MKAIFKACQIYGNQLIKIKLLSYYFFFR